MGEADDRDEANGLVDRINERLKALDMTVATASMAAFQNYKTLKLILNGTTKNPGLGTIRQLATTLDCAPAWLAWGAGSPTPWPEMEGASVWRPKAAASPRPAPRSLRYLGKVATGLWRDEDTHVDEPALKGPPIPPNPLWPVEAQFVVMVEGTSVDRVIPDGTPVACVDPRMIGERAKNGDLVIVERRRSDRGESERTAKRFRRNGDVIELWPESNDPAHKPIILDPREPAEGMEVVVIGIVDRAVVKIEPSRPWDHD